MQVQCYISAYILPEENTADQNSLPTRLKQDMSLLQRIHTTHPLSLGKASGRMNPQKCLRFCSRTFLDFPCTASLRTTQH